MAAQRPLVWLSACHRNLDIDEPGGYSVLADRYAVAVCKLNMQPVLYPAAGTGDVPELITLVDGVLLTDSPSNGQGIKRLGRDRVRVRRAMAPRMKL